MAEIGGESRALVTAQVKRPLIWVVVTVSAALAAHRAVSPQSCLTVRSCTETAARLPALLNAYATCGLVTVFLHEVASLWLNYRSARPLVGLITGIENVFVPPLLLCIMFAVLVLENYIFMSGNDAALSHSGAPGAWIEAGRPVYTIIYMEWLINVPLLIILAGKCALGRPLRDVTGPLLCTNVYIIIAWSAHFVASAALRWTLVCSSFAMYGWSSYEMAQWVVEYCRTADVGAPSRVLRPCLTTGLIVMFGVYGIVYVIAGLGMITGYTERVSYIGMNIGVKLIMSMAFAGIRSSEYHDMLVDMLINTKIPFQRQIACSSIGVAEGQAVERHSGDLSQPLVNHS